MRRYDLLSDLRDHVRACLGAGCAYQLVITRGRPPHECDLVAFWVGNDTVDPFSDCGDASCDLTREFPVMIELVRICAAPQANVNMDFVAEEEQARCFYNDLDAIECCFDAGPWAQLRSDHGIDSISRVRTIIDPTSRGGAFSARLQLNVTLTQCCVD